MLVAWTAEVANILRLILQNWVIKLYLGMSSDDALAQILHGEHADNLAGGIANEQVPNVSCEKLDEKCGH